MTKEQAEKVVAILEKEGIEASVYENYSGRCMFGATCVGIVCGDLLAVGSAMAKAKIPAKDRPRRQDNMGLDMIVY